MKVAIHRNDKVFKHSTNWNNKWEKICIKNNIKYGIVNCFSSNIIEELSEYDCLLWHFSNYSPQEMKFARSILYAAEMMGICVFPNFYTNWHFDDKVAESYLLKAIGAPTPVNYIFHDKLDCRNWIKTKAKFPLIAKLRCGSGSNNVKLIKNDTEALKYIDIMFGKGFTNQPGIMFKMGSNLKTANNFSTIIKRVKRIPDFIQTINSAKKLEKESNYAYFQEFIENDGFDLKIVVIGDKLSYICRNIRKDDFRASGGGSLFFDKSLVTDSIIDSAFKTTDDLSAQCIGYDYVVDKRTGEGKIIEISYGFSYSALLEAGGYWDRNHNWHDEPMNAPYEVLNNLMN